MKEASEKCQEQTAQRCKAIFAMNLLLLNQVKNEFKSNK